MALDDDQPDYTTMSGAEFKRAVGADPAKWAGRFLDAWAAAPIEVGTRRGELEFVTSWFRDFGEAAVKAATAPRWEEQYSDADLEAAVKDAASNWDKLA